MPQRSYKAGGLRAALRLALAVAAGAGVMGWGKLPDKALAQPLVEELGGAVRRVKVTRGKSRTFEVSVPFASAVVGSPDIADVLPMSDRVLYVQGKKVGTTNVTIFDKNKRVIAILDVDVTVDTRAVADRIRANIDSKGITVSSSQEQLILGGQAKNAVDAEQAVAIAKTAAPELQLVNLIKVASAQQVLLKVRFIEASRTAERDLGLTWFANAGKGRGAVVGLGSVGGTAANTLLPSITSSAGSMATSSLCRGAGQSCQQGCECRFADFRAGIERAGPAPRGAGSGRALRRYGKLHRRRRGAGARGAALVRRHAHHHRGL